MIGYRIDAARRLVIANAEGALPADEISRWQVQLRADPDFDPRLALLIDLRSANLATVETPDVRRYAENDPFAATSPRAILISSDADYGLVRMFEAYSEMAGRSGPVQAFRDPEAALIWIAEVRAAEP